MSDINDRKNKTQALLKQFSPDQQAIAETIAGLKIENRVLSESIAKLKSNYDPLFKFMVVLLDASETKEIRAHITQFKRFNEEYRIDNYFDAETEEMVFELKTLSE